MPCVVQRRLFQPRSQTQRWRFPRPGLVQSMIPLDCTNQRPRADFPSVCLHSIALPVCARDPCLCMPTPDRFPLCPRRHSQPRPFCLCRSTLEGSTSLVFASHRRSQSPSLKFQALVRTLGPGFPNLLSPDPQVRFGPARWMNPNLNIGSGSGATVHQVCEPDHGQSMAHACRKFLHFPDENNTGKRTHMRVFTPRGLHNTTTCLVTHALGTHALCLFCFHRSF